MKGFYKKIEEEVDIIENGMTIPNVGNYKVSDYSIDGTHIINGWVYFNTREAAEEYFKHPVFHEQTEKRIILGLLDNTRLIQDVPELGVYLKQNNINSYIDGQFVYIYVNYILTEHETLIISYNGTIQDNSVNS